MDKTSIAPCGINCDICSGFQRTKNKCVGCNNVGYKPHYCEVCKIKTCPEKNGNDKLLCNNCVKFPCKRIKDLDKRYRTKYGENIIQNLETISQIGIESFIEQEKIKWKCKQCGNLVCVHKEKCLVCGAKNEHFPERPK